MSDNLIALAKKNFDRQKVFNELAEQCASEPIMDIALDKIESLRQQLAAAHSIIADKTSHINWLDDRCSNGWDQADELSEQLADSKKREVMLRNALERIVQTSTLYTYRIANEALTATEPKP